MPSPLVNPRLSASLSLAAMVAATFAFSANCSSSSLGPANGSPCNVNGDCASNCCVAGGYPAPAQAGDLAKVCAEPTGCSGQDSSVSSVDSSMTEETGAETGVDSGGSADSSSPVDSSSPPVDSGEKDSGKGDSSVQDSGHDTGAPKDAGKG